mmetsp:Transcript_75333/g.243950  ORF Transcript_75333/g.243950 Transcript_75333/m.243950 type:complete len:395 (+) Transcript_75333:28-1212(+)
MALPQQQWLGGGGGGTFPQSLLLERHAAGLSARVGEGRLHLRVVQRGAAEAAASRDRLTEELMVARRRSRVAAAARKDSEGALEAAEATRQAAQKDAVGLRRTLARLQVKQETIVKEVKKEKVVVEEVEDALSDVRVQEASLRQSVVGLQEVGETLRRRAELERQKRLMLKASARIKLQRVEDDMDALRSAAEECNSETEVMHRSVAESEARAQAAEADLVRSRAELRTLEEIISEQLLEKSRLQFEFTCLQRAQEDLRKELEAMNAEAAEHGRQKCAAQKVWCSTYMEKASAKSDRVRMLDQDYCVASDESHLFELCVLAQCHSEFQKQDKGSPKAIKRLKVVPCDIVVLDFDTEMIPWAPHRVLTLVVTGHHDLKLHTNRESRQCLGRQGER